MYGSSRYNQSQFAQPSRQTIVNVFSLTINHTLIIHDSYNVQSPNILFVNKSGIKTYVKTYDSLIIQDLNLGKHYSIVKYWSVTFTNTVQKINELKRFFNYYYNEPILMNNYTSIYEARLDFSENTRKYLYMFRDDTTITLNFHAIRVG